MSDIKKAVKIVEKAKEELEQKAPENENAKKDIGKLVVEEETEHGNVGWDSSASKFTLLWKGLDAIFHSVWLFIGNVGKRPSLFWMIYIGVFVIRHIIANIQVSFSSYIVTQC